MTKRRGRDGAVDKIIGENIRRIRRSHHMSQTELGDAVGITFQQIQKYKNGINSIAASRVPAFCAALDISLADLFEGTEVSGTPRQRERRKKK
jgi:transcriptional regulator with XRE-family HTH domain